jgi:hypothetical protein
MPSLIRFFIFKCFVFIAIVGCNKEDFVWDLPKTNPYDVVDTFGVHYPNQNSPVVVTAGNFNVTTSSLEVFGSVNYVGSSEIIHYGHCWSTSPLPDTNDAKSDFGFSSTIINFKSVVNGLLPNTKYYVRSYAINSYGLSYGNQITLETLNPVPTLSTVISCESLTGFNSSFEHWHYDQYDAHTWSIASTGYNGSCFIARNGGNNGAIGGFLEFPITISDYNNGFITFWMRSGTSGTWYGANRMPVIYLDGVQMLSPTVIEGNSEFDWQKIKTSAIGMGNHIIKIYWPNVSNTAIDYKIDEIETWEYE